MCNSSTLAYYLSGSIGEGNTLRGGAQGQGGSRPLKRRVLYAIALDPSQKFGSMEEQLVWVASNAPQNQIAFLPLFDAPASGDTLAAFEEHAAPWTSLNLHGFSMVRLRSLLRIIDENKIDLIHWNFYPPFHSYLYLLSLLRPRIKHYLTDHNSRGDGMASSGLARRAVKSLLYRRYKKIFCNSDYTLSHLRDEGVSRLKRIHYFVNTQRFSPCAESESRLRIQYAPSGSFIALFMAHLIEEKGGDVFLGALAKLSDQFVGWIVGDGPDRMRLEEMVKELGLEQRVRFFGRQARTEPFVQAANCLVCPSQWSEAFGLVNIEAMACGIPVVASGVGGIPEIVLHENTGLLCNPSKPEEFAAAILRLQHDSDLYSRLSKNAMRLVQDQFSMEQRGPEHVAMYFSDEI